MGPDEAQKKFLSSPLFSSGYRLAGSDRRFDGNVRNRKGFGARPAEDGRFLSRFGSLEPELEPRRVRIDRPGRRRGRSSRFRPRRTGCSGQAPRESSGVLFPGL